MRGKIARNLAAGTLVLFLPFRVWAGIWTVTPSDRVSTRVNVRAQAVGGSSVVGKLQVGETAEIIEESSGYWKVRLDDDDDTEGFVSKAWVIEVVPYGAADSAGDAIFKGTPESTDTSSAFKVLHNVGFTIGYSETRKTPLWVSYRLEAVRDPGELPDRPSKFRIDRRTDAEVDHDCYTNSGYDRGDMAPNYGIIPNVNCFSPPATIKLPHRHWFVGFCSPSPSPSPSPSGLV